MINFSLLLIGWIITVTFITLLQLIDSGNFLIVLLLMHIGIAFIIVSRRRFIYAAVDIKGNYRILNLLLLLYLPLIVGKIMANATNSVTLKSLIGPVTYGITAFVVVISILPLTRTAKLCISEKER